MKLGTIAYQSKIYNLDYMTAQEIQDLIHTVETNQAKRRQAEKQTKHTSEKQTF